MKEQSEIGLCKWIHERSKNHPEHAFTITGINIYPEMNSLGSNWSISSINASSYSADLYNFAFNIFIEARENFPQIFRASSTSITGMPSRMG